MSSVAGGRQSPQRLWEGHWPPGPQTALGTQGWSRPSLEDSRDGRGRVVPGPHVPCTCSRLPRMASLW